MGSEPRSLSHNLAWRSDPVHGRRDGESPWRYIPVQKSGKTSLLTRGITSLVTSRERRVPVVPIRNVPEEVPFFDAKLKLRVVWRPQPVGGAVTRVLASPLPPRRLRRGRGLRISVVTASCHVSDRLPVRIILNEVNLKGEMLTGALGHAPTQPVTSTSAHWLKPPAVPMPPPTPH